MGHVVYEIVLDLTHLLLSDKGVHRHIKGRNDDKRKKDGACDHQPHLAKDDILVVWYNDDQDLIRQDAADIRIFGRLQKHKAAEILRGILDIIYKVRGSQLVGPIAETGVAEIGGN